MGQQSRGSGSHLIAGLRYGSTQPRLDIVARRTRMVELEQCIAHHLALTRILATGNARAQALHGLLGKLHRDLLERTHAGLPFRARR